MKVDVGVKLEDIKTMESFAAWMLGCEINPDIYSVGIYEDYAEVVMPYGHNQIDGNFTELIADVKEFTGGKNYNGLLPGTHHRLAVVVDVGGNAHITVSINRDIRVVSVLKTLAAEGKSLLVLGEPGAGKTTILRSLIEVVAQKGGYKVLDGTGDIVFGKVRGIDVYPFKGSSAKMVSEIVQGQRPEGIVLDEIMGKAAIAAVRLVKMKGCAVIGTAHGNLTSLLASDDASLVATLEKATVKQDSPESRETGSQVVTEATDSGIFDVVAEIIGHNGNQAVLVIHDNIQHSAGRLIYKNQAGQLVYQPQVKLAVGMVTISMPYDKAWEVGNKIVKGEITLDDLDSKGNIIFKKKAKLEAKPKVEPYVQPEAEAQPATASAPATKKSRFKMPKVSLPKPKFHNPIKGLWEKIDNSII